MAVESVRLTPLRSILLLLEQGIQELAVSEISADRVGVKAVGLSSIPPAWTEPFLVIEASCPANDDPAIQEALLSALRSIDLDSGPVMVRSSGTKETMRDRGALASAPCSVDEIFATIRRLSAYVGGEEHGQVHWIIQRQIVNRASGNLSNERRVSYNNRDWLLAVDFSMERQPTSLGRIAFRPWRDRRSITFNPLHSNTELGISVALREVVKWGSGFSQRLHLEWVWNGTQVSLVQAEVWDADGGVNPYSALDRDINAVGSDGLTLFRRASPADYSRYRKLEKTRLYSTLGYSMPEFFVLDDPASMARLIAGDVPSELESDLTILTRRSLIIRTDGTSIPAEKREMLPRSDELTSATSAIHWLKERFHGAITTDGLASSNLCLIAHHFIPSVASAWARAEPGARIVHVEALWGLPEGLYWYAHDTYKIDTGTPILPKDAKPGKLKYNFKRRLRFKGTFYGSDDHGNWITYEPCPPFDWRPAIRLEQWLFEIALVTRRIADAEARATSVMWFIDNHPRAIRHRVLPWYHSESEALAKPRAAPPRKFVSSRDFEIKDEADWAKLQVEFGSGAHFERVRVEPTDPTLIRNPEFARSLAALSIAKGFVIELSGGVLSHAYYLLTKAGARVECVDLFDVDEEVSPFDKIVRDKIADIIFEGGERAETVRLSGNALLSALQQKLVEEALEALDAAQGEELIGELADVLEVIHATSSAVGASFATIERERKQKRKTRGGFDTGLMLKSTGTPQGLHPRDVGESWTSSDGGLISDKAALPKRSVYRHQDLRQPGEKQVEKQLTVEAPIFQLTNHKEFFSFTFPNEDGDPEEYSLILELQRDKADLRAVVRLRKEPIQLHLQF